MADGLTETDTALAPLLLRLTGEWRSYDVSVMPRADTAAMYLLCRAGLVELRFLGWAWGKQTALDFEATVSGVWLDADHKSLLPEELRKCVPAWRNERVATQLEPKLEVRLTPIGVENRREIEDDPAAQLLFPAFVAHHGVAGRVSIRLFDKQCRAPGAEPVTDEIADAFAAGVVNERPAEFTPQPTSVVEVVEGEEQIPEKRYTHRPWPGSKDWHNWGVGSDEQGMWHLFHYQRSGDTRAIFRWIRHTRARVPISAGQMDELARRFAREGSVQATDAATIERLKPVVSRLRKVIREAVAKEGHRPTGNLIKSPSKTDPAWTALIVFGTVVVRERHNEFVPFKP
jgi:hypothetical protein